MSVSLIILSVIILLIMFGIGQRILDSLRLSDKQALIILILICIGIIIPPIWIGKYFCFSIGGFLIPFALSIYLLISCGWSRDLLRTMIGTILVASIIYLLEWVLPADPEEMIIDTTYLYGLVAGIVAYILGRSRRNAFVSCLFGITLAQIVQWIVNFSMDSPTILGLGVGGAFGAYVISLIIAVAVSEFLGRCFEGATIPKEKKEFDYNSHTYKSEKNGKLKEQNVNKDEKVDELAASFFNVKNANFDKNNENNAKEALKS